MPNNNLTKNLVAVLNSWLNCVQVLLGILTEQFWNPISLFFETDIPCEFALLFYFQFIPQGVQLLKSALMHLW